VANVIETMQIVYETVIADRSSRGLLQQERKTQAEVAKTSRQLKLQEQAAKGSASAQMRLARQREQAEARAAAAARRSAADQERAARRSRATQEGLLRRGAATARGHIAGAVGAVAGFATLAGAEKAVGVTETLAKTTIQLGGAFGLAARDASRWAAVTQARGVEGKQLAMGFKTLSTQIRGATQATGKQSDALDALRAKNAVRIAQAEQDAARMKDQAAARQKLDRVYQAAGAAETALAGKTATSAKLFEQLGISQQELTKHGGDMNWMLHAVSDGLAGVSSKSEKSAIMAKLFGRTALTIAPILREGSKAMDEQLGLADKYGASMGTETVAELKKHIAAEREAKLAVMGLQIAFGTHVAPVMTTVIEKFARFSAEMHSGTGAGGRFAKQAGQIAHELTPVAHGLQTVGGFLVAHPRLVVAAAGAYAAFKTARGLLGIGRDLKDIGGTIAAVTKRAARSRLAALIADGARGAGRLVGRAIGPVVDVVSTTMSKAAQAGSSALGGSARWKTAGRSAGRAFSAGLAIGAAVGLTAVAAEAIGKLKDEMRKQGLGPKKGSFWDDLLPSNLLPTFKLEGPLGKLLKQAVGKRAGGVIHAMGDGGLVPFMAAGGELVVDGGHATVVPGDPRRDATPMWARPGTAVLTADGQARMAAGASLGAAVRAQAPHFAKGGLIPGDYDSTAYGPPWVGIQGSGVTATGVNLRRSPHVYGIAVDPRMIPLGSQTYAWPNPFHRSGPFRAFDTGGAIHGRRVDFYDWRGRGSQNAWGHKTVRISAAKVHGLGSGKADPTADVTARVPLTLRESRTRQGLLDDAVTQGIAAGEAGLTRSEIAAAARGDRGARVNPILAAIQGAQTPVTREVKIPGSTGGAGAASTGPLPSGVSRPGAKWNPARLPIAKWIVPYLSAAARGGGSSGAGSRGPARRGAGSAGRWTGTVTSGFRTLAQQTRIWKSGVRPAAKPGTSNHEKSTFPGGAVDVTQASLLSQVLARLPGKHLLRWAGAKDPVHFSYPHGGSYRRGGVVGGVGGRLGSAVSSAMSFRGGSFEALDAAIGGAVDARLDQLRGEIVARVRRGGSKKTVQRLQSILDLIDFEVGRRIGRAYDVVARRQIRLDRATAATDRAQRLAGIDPTSPQGLAMTGALGAAETGSRRRDVATLQRALTAARRTGNREVIRDAIDRLNEARDALAESLVRQVETWRDRLRAAGAEAVNAASFRTGLVSSASSIVESWQRTAGVQDTPGAMAQRANMIVGATIPALEQQRKAAEFAAVISASTGDLAGWRSAIQDAASAAADIASAQADAADLMRAAAARAAQDVVDAAGHGRSMADMGLQRLDLEQQLIGTHDTTGAAQGRADFITQTIIPAIQGEIAALVAQQAVAQAAGDRALANQIAEAIYGKQNDVLSQQLAAQQETAANTSALKDFGGSLAFGYQGQIQTDLDVIRARAGA
jgi:3D (Asp-Asp-Asp) domain-containing protein